MAGVKRSPIEVMEKAKHKLRIGWKEEEILFSEMHINVVVMPFIEKLGT